jgi:predicted membrane protein
MKIENITVFENILGVILAAFIVFQVLPNSSVCRTLNEPVYIILGLVFVILLFLTLNPIIGILFLIYFYQLLMKGKQDHTYKKNRKLKALNPEKDSELEEIVIQNSNFARIKNKGEDEETNVLPILEKLKI